MIINEKFKTLIPEIEIQKRVRELADEISSAHHADRLIIIGLLQGSFVFLADLIRSLSSYALSLQVDFMTVSSYDSGTKSSGKIDMIQDIRIDISDKHVLLVDDIYDTGQTLNFVLDHLKARKPASIKTCVLLYKEVIKVKPVQLDFTGFKVPDAFVVGYGLDYDNRYRGMPDISILSFEK